MTRATDHPTGGNVRPLRKRVVPAPVEAPTPIPEPAARMTADGSLVSTMALKARDCRWPIGDVGETDFHYCGNEQLEGHSYCEFHLAKSRANPASVANVKRWEHWRERSAAVHIAIPEF